MSVAARQNLVNLCRVISRRYDLKVTFKECLKGAAIAGLGALLGGLLGGSKGVAIGGTMGALGGAFVAAGKYKSVLEVIDEMSDEEKNRLADSVMEVVRGVELRDFDVLLSAVLANKGLQNLIVREISNFLDSEMKLKMIDY